MNHFTHLQEFIRTNENWKDVIHHKPYCVRISPCPFNDKWNLLMYNMHHCDFSLDVVRECRGTVVDDDGNIICAPYTKFFNHDDQFADTIDWQSAIVREKIDGVLIKMFKHDGRAYWLSNGGWDIWHIDLTGTPFNNAEEMLNSLLDAADRQWIDRIPDGYTLMFEMVSPFSRIICFYNETKLWFHGIRDNNGDEMTPEAAKERFGIPFDIPRQYPFHSLEEVQAAIGSWQSYSQEGVVACDKDFKRLKIKCEDYINKKFGNDANSLRQLWRIWADGCFDDLPEGELRWRVMLMKDVIDNQQYRFEQIWNAANRLLTECGNDYKLCACKICESEESPLFKNLLYTAARNTKDDFLQAAETDLKQNYGHFLSIMAECGANLTPILAGNYELNRTGF